MNERLVNPLELIDISTLAPYRDIVELDIRVPQWKVNPYARFEGMTGGSARFLIAVYGVGLANLIIPLDAIELSNSHQKKVILTEQMERYIALIDYEEQPEKYAKAAMAMARSLYLCKRT